MSTSTPPLQAWVDGRLVTATDATIPATDQGFRTGIGVFSTLRCYQGQVLGLDVHLSRMMRGAAELDIEVDPGMLADAVAATVRANMAAHTTGDTVVRVTVSAGAIDPASAFPGVPIGAPTVVVTTHDLIDDDRQTRGIRLQTVALPRAVAHVKTTSHLSAIVAQRRAHAQGADDALLVTDDGHVLEGASGNVFAVRGGRIHTPPDDGRLLAGVTRSAVIAAATHLGHTVMEDPLPLPTLLTADEVLLTSAVREVVPVTAIDGNRIGTGRPGHGAAALQRAYRDMVARELARAVH